MLALGQIASLSFISSVGTIGCTVTDRGQVNAAVRYAWTRPLAMRALQRRFGAGVLDALVRSIAAVIFTVANVGFEHALVVVTLVEVVGTRDLATVILVRVIVTVLGAVAAPCNRYADARRLTLEVLLTVALVGGDRGTSELIAAVVAVWDAITLVRLLDALS